MTIASNHLVVSANVLNSAKTYAIDYHRKSSVFKASITVACKTFPPPVWNGAPIKNKHRTSVKMNLFHMGVYRIYKTSFVCVRVCVFVWFC